MQNSYRQLQNCRLQNLYGIYKLKTGKQNEWLPITLTSFIYIWQKLRCSWRWNAELNNCSDVSSKTAITKAGLPCVRSYFYLLCFKPVSSCTVQVMHNQITLNSKSIISALTTEILWYTVREHVFLCRCQTEIICVTLLLSRSHWRLFVQTMAIYSRIRLNSKVLTSSRLYIELIVWGVRDETTLLKQRRSGSGQCLKCLRSSPTPTPTPTPTPWILQ